MNNGYYTVDCTNAIWSGKEFTSRRKAEKHIARLRRVYPQLVRDRQKFTIRWVSTEDRSSQKER